jgi:hypothetical protein
MDKVQKHNSFNTNAPSSESYKNDLYKQTYGQYPSHITVAYKREFVRVLKNHCVNMSVGL